MAMGQFTPPNFDPLVNRRQEMGLEQVFDTAIKLSLMKKEQDQKQKDMQAQRVLATAQYGFDPYSITPEQAQQALGVAPQGPTQPGQQLEPQGVTGLRQYIAQQKRLQELGMQEKQAGIEKEQGQGAQAQAMAGMLGGGGVGAEPELIEKDGITFRKVLTRQGPQWSPIPAAPVAIDPSTGEQVQLPRGGKIVSAPGAAKANEIIGKAQAMRSAIDTQERLLQQTPSGRVAGGAALLANKLTGAYPEVAAASGMSGVLQNMIARIISGEVGNLSETDLKITQGLVPRVSGTKAEQQLVFKELRALIDRKEKEAQGVARPGMFRGGQMPANTPQAGMVKNGYRFRGGNPSDKNNWEKVR